MNREKIIVALDVSTAADAFKYVEMLKGEVGAFKIGLQLFTAEGATLVKKLVGIGVKIFLDLKFHDIPNTAAKASVEAARLGVWMFNLHALGGEEMMRRAMLETREVCEKENIWHPLVIGVTVLTSSSDQTLQQTGISATTIEQVSRLSKLTAQSGLDGIVASPLEIETIRRNVEQNDFKIVTPGIRPNLENSLPENLNDDQKRIMTPAEALRAGADYLVIGRPILTAPDPLQAIEKIVSQFNL